jgi:ankyrin repeat protein
MEAEMRTPILSMLVLLALPYRTGLDLNDDLIQAAKAGDAANIILLLEKGADTNARTVDGDTPLLLAAAGGHNQALIALLLKDDKTRSASNISWSQADVNARNKRGETALMWAAKAGIEQNLILLLSRKANIAIKDTSGETALAWAEKNSQSRCADLLRMAQDRADADLLIGAQSGENSRMEEALAVGANLDGIAEQAFVLAVGNGRAEPIRWLLAKGVDANLQGEKGWTPLMIAAFQGKNADILEVLLENGADINSHDKEGFTALMISILASHLDTMTALLSRGANPNSLTKKGYTALMIAASKGNIEAVHELLVRNANVALVASDGATAIKLAGDNETVLRLLKTAGAK